MKRKIALIVQRCGKDIIGGSESFTLNLASKLSSYFDIEILTTCARDYTTWKNYYPEGSTHENGVLIRRFRNDYERDPKEFNSLSSRLATHSTYEDELLWMKMQGPYSSMLINFLKENKNNYDLFVFNTHLYASTFFGLPEVSKKSVLIPHSDADWSLRLSIFDKIYSLSKTIICQTEEERMILIKRFENIREKSQVINQGVIGPIEIPPNFHFKQKIDFPYVMYLGRIDESKGSKELIEYFSRFKRENPSDLKLILVGPKNLEFSPSTDILYYGIVDNIEKSFLLRHMMAFFMPSKHESFSIATIEAWLCKKPVIGTAKSPVVKGHCEKSNGGLFYENYNEFAECLKFIISSPETSLQLGKNGYDYASKNYTMEKMIEGYHDFFSKMS